MSASPLNIDAPATTELRSGPGAPIFEPGPNTRIRRHATRAIATMTWSGGPREIFGQVVNVSLNGCLVKTESTIADGTEVDLTVTVIGGPEVEKFALRALIRRRTEVAGRRAYGLEFVCESSEERELTQRLYAETAR
ncbi:PilZ domain-containing protein [Bradymonadaceae bacterium TMQ3]|uniref:PilZ domain-containing protein n=1 Tax=Lujinxingia sediminis TaxID=2480984 RepID=A0ABY0CXW6_9DELT|nr:PilZ domain-containing protein [Lujinxingia sediminis]RDV39239.1 PilZ domain-containing protein [Bradymonadaceae bacterium TMQ3]RVU48721.1 PilZ domain-containing protein [Lujinxingia sediminis]TXC78014.1 PilZ domain-containing protein [Bradymonadales bacterium TMQ1]